MNKLILQMRNISHRIKQTTSLYMTEGHVYYRTRLVFHLPSSGLHWDSIHLWVWFEEKLTEKKQSGEFFLKSETYNSG